MPLEFPDKTFFTAAVGYCELGLFADANAELEKIDPFNRIAPECLVLRVEIYRGLEKWELMQAASQCLCELAPSEAQWIISYAYATKRAESVVGAKNILINSMARFPREPIIYYNLACYDCQLGLLESAKNYLNRAFEIDSKWRLQALDDEDLKPLWDSL